MTATLHWMAVLAATALTVGMAARVVFCGCVRSAVASFLWMLVGTAALFLLAMAPLAAAVTALLSGTGLAFGGFAAAQMAKDTAPVPGDDSRFYEPWLAGMSALFLFIALVGIARNGFGEGRGQNVIREIVERLGSPRQTAGRSPAVSDLRKTGVSETGMAEVPNPSTQAGVVATSGRLLRVHWLAAGLGGVLALMTMLTATAMVASAGELHAAPETTVEEARETCEPSGGVHAG